MLSFRNVTKVYYSGVKPITAVDHVSFEVQPKEFICIAGRSGAGKTTLLKLLLVEEKPSQGSILFEEQDIYQIKPADLPLYRRKIGAIFQDYKLLPSKTTYENLAYVKEVMGASDQEIADDVSKVLEITGLKERAHNFPEELSGGERQRAAIARALIHQPGIILADEPTGNLDPFHTQDIIRLLDKINQMGTTVILATHNREIINTLRKRVITLEAGKIIRDEERGRFIL